MRTEFPFKELSLSSKLLDMMGFTEYWAGCGEFGDRRLDLGAQVGDERLTSKKEYPKYFIHQIDEFEAGSYSYAYIEYSPEHFADKNFKPMYFLHDMYEDVLVRRTPEEVEKFVEIASMKELGGYLDSYLKWKEENEKT